MRLLARIVVTTLLLSLVASGFADAAPDRGSETPAPRAHRVIAFDLRATALNIELWFRYHTDPSTWDDYLSDRDIALLVEQGFGSVRLCLFPEYFLGRDGALRTGRWAHVDRALDRLIAAGLTVVVDLHSETKAWGAFSTDPDYRVRYTQMAAEIAVRLSARDPSTVALSLMNEPHDDHGRWDGWQQALHGAVRAAAPGLTLVLTGAQWGSLGGLRHAAYIADPNVIWDVHLYEPFQLTHAGAPWVDYPERAFRNVPFPSSPRRVRQAIRTSVAAAPPEWKRQVRRELAWYGHQRWNGAKVDAMVAEVQAWSAGHDNAAVWIGEFGVNNTSRREPAYRWWRALRMGAESRSIPWATWFWWDWKDRYGAHGRGDPGLADALGLP